MAGKVVNKAQVLEKVPKGTDIETHVRVVTLGDVTYVELRDYIPSTKEYGRGYWIPDTPEALRAITGALDTRRKALK